MKILKEQHGFVCAVCSVVSDSVTPWTVESTRLLCLWDSPGKNTGVGCHFLLQGIFLTRELNLRLLYWQADSLLLSHLGNPKKKKKRNAQKIPHTQLGLQLCPFLVLLLLLLLYASVRNTPGSSPKALHRQTPACYFPTASALWPHKSGRDDSPGSVQDGGANKGLWLTVTTPVSGSETTPRSPLQTGTRLLSPCHLPSPWIICQKVLSTLPFRSV